MSTAQKAKVGAHSSASEPAKPKQGDLEVTSRGVLKKDSADILRTETAQRFLQAFIKHSEDEAPSR